MKQWLIVPILAIVASCAIISCGGDDAPIGEAPPTPIEPKSEEKPYLRVSNPLLTLDSQNPEETIYIYTKESWTINDVPEWISVSPVKGEGELHVTVKTLEPEALESRSGKFLITAGDLTVTISVEQKGTMSLTVTDEVILSDSFCAFLELGDKVVSYTGLAIPSSEYQYMPEAYVEAQLKNGNIKTKGSNNELMWTGRKANTEYSVCMVGFDADGKMGPIVVRTIKTPPESFVWDATISNLTALSNRWTFSINMTAQCRHYYLIYYKDATAVSASATTSDIVFASVIKQNMSQLTMNSNSKEDYIQRTSSNYALFMVTWGLNQNDEFSARLSRAYKNTNTSYSSNQQAAIPFSPNTEAFKNESIPDEFLKNVEIMEVTSN